MFGTVRLSKVGSLGHFSKQQCYVDNSIMFIVSTFSGHSLSTVSFKFEQLADDINWDKVFIKVTYMESMKLSASFD